MECNWGWRYIGKDRIRNEDKRKKKTSRIMGEVRDDEGRKYIRIKEEYENQNKKYGKRIKIGK